MPTDRRRENRWHPRSRATSANPAPSASIAAVRLARPYLPVGSSPAAAQDDEVHLGNRHLVKLDEPDGQPVAQLALLNGRQFQRRGGTRHRRLAAVRGLRSERRRGHQESNNEGASIHCKGSHHEVTKRTKRALSFLWYHLGTTISSTRRFAGRNTSAAARTSDGEMARYRARSSLNQSGSPVVV